MSEERPTKKQRELLGFIEGFIATHGYGPSYRELMRSVGYKSVSTVATHVDNLIKKGHLRKRDRSARSLEVCRSDFKTDTSTRSASHRTEEKWLVNAVGDRLKAIENKKTTPKEVDQLYVLIGALYILGLAEAATAAKARLAAIENSLEG